VGFYFSTVLDTSVVDDFVRSWNNEAYMDHIIGDVPWSVNICS